MMTDLNWLCAVAKYIFFAAPNVRSKLTLGPMYESEQGQSRIGFFGVVPLPFLNANRRGIAQARASRELARAAFETTTWRASTERSIRANDAIDARRARRRAVRDRDDAR